MLKRTLQTQTTTHGHWVGDGFPVKTIFSHPSHGQSISPFLLMDHAGPANFEPSDTPRGVEEHPHKGFETVTIVYRGEVQHRDSGGGGGLIGPGEVQWMTAGSGVVHEEMHGPDFTRRGGELEMIQLWVNLPARDKRTPPAYQTLTNDQIPKRALPGGAGSVRYIAGGPADVPGPARTFTPVQLWDVAMVEGGELHLPWPAGQTAMVFVRQGRVALEDGTSLETGGLAILDRQGDEVALKAEVASELLLLGGEPIDEPVVMRGPFAMNTAAEIQQAIQEYQTGLMGTLR